MRLQLCPFCVQVNPLGANFCSACGLTLVAPARSGDDANGSDEVDTVPGDIENLDLTLRSLDEAGEQQATLDEPRTHKETKWRPSLPPRAADDTRPRPGAAVNPGAATAAPSAAPASQGIEAPLAGLIRSEPDANFHAPESARSVAKAAHRARVRRALQATTAQSTGASAASTNLLVMDNNDGDRGQLCSLLEGFGFDVHTALTINQAVALLDLHTFAAVFAAILLDTEPQGAAARLCERVKRAPAQTSIQSPALFIIAERARSVDRVRAALAGADKFLLKPLSRGEVVRALADSGVPLPVDHRRA